MKALQSTHTKSTMTSTTTPQQLADDTPTTIMGRIASLRKAISGGDLETKLFVQSGTILQDILTLVTLVGAYITLWTPIGFMYILSPFMEPPAWWEGFSEFMILMNSITYPVLMLFFF